MSVGLEELEEAIARLRDQETTHRKRLGAVVEQLLALEARDLVAAAPAAGGTPLVRQVRDTLDLAEARLLASAIAAEGGIALLGLRGEKAQVLLARPAGHTLDCGRVLREALSAVGGRGGGQSQMAQGGVPDPSQLEALLDGLEARIR